MIIYTNWINLENNCRIAMDIDTGIFTCVYTFNDKYTKKIYPLGTTRKSVVNQMEKLFKEVA